MRHKEAIKAEEDGALVTDGDYVYKIIKHSRGYMRIFTIQRQTLGIPFDEIDVDPITVTSMWRLKNE